MKENPCKNCTLGNGKWGGTKYRAGCGIEQYRCAPHLRHEEYLASRRKYRIGSPIIHSDDLEKCEFVYWGNKIMHISWIKSLQWRLVLESLRIGAFRQAIKKEPNVE